MLFKTAFGMLYFLNSHQIKSGLLVMCGLCFWGKHAAP